MDSIASLYTADGRGPEPHRGAGTGSGRAPQRPPRLVCGPAIVASNRGVGPLPTLPDFPVGALLIPRGPPRSPPPRSPLPSFSVWPKRPATRTTSPARNVSSPAICSSRAGGSLPEKGLTLVSPCGSALGAGARRVEDLLPAQLRRTRLASPFFLPREEGLGSAKLPLSLRAAHPLLFAIDAIRSGER